MSEYTNQTRKKNRGRRRVLLFIEIVCIIVAIVCIGLLVKEGSRYVIANQEFEEITERTGRDIGALQKENPDCIGWIEVPDTRIDYPVMYTRDDPEFYLHRNFKKEYSSAGTPFLGDGSDPIGNSLIIYGHHMRDGSMFAELLKFDDKEFGKGHEIIFTTKSGEKHYKAVGCWYEDLSSGSPYRYWDHVGTIDKEEYDAYVKAVKDRRLYDTGVDAKYGQNLLTLSTCSYGTSEQRFIVVGVEE